MAFHTDQITAWSYSRFSDYDQCPKKAFFKHVKKIKEPGNAAMDRGSAIHKEAEDFVLGNEKRLSPNLKSYANDFRRLKKAGATAEANWTFRKDWSLTEWNDWNGAWARIKVDASLEHPKEERLEIIDYKTGKVKANGELQLQLELYAVAAFTVYPAIQSVTTALWFLDHPQAAKTNPTEEVYERPQFNMLRKGWEKRVMPMLRDKTFKETPGNHCRYCWFRKGNAEYPGGQGPCKY